MFGNWGRCECNNQGKCEKGDACFFKKAKAALERAHDIRKFEIELLWKRAAYVATFQTLLFAAVGLSFRADTDNGNLIDLFQIVTCIAGVFSSFFWRLINKGSKFGMKTGPSISIFWSMNSRVICIKRCCIAAKNLYYLAWQIALKENARKKASQIKSLSGPRRNPIPFRE